MSDVFMMVLNGLSKALNVANQTIPIYNQVKPTISKSKNILSSLNKSVKKGNNAEIKSIKKEDNNLPIFFS